MSKLRNIHPGEVLELEFLKPLAVTQYRAAKETGLSQTAISEICRGTRGISAETALRLAAFLGTTPEFWMSLQDRFALLAARSSLGAKLKKIHRLRAA